MTSSRSLLVSAICLATGLLIGLGLSGALGNGPVSDGVTGRSQAGWSTSSDLVAAARKDVLACNVNPDSDANGYRHVMAWRLAELVFRRIDPIRFFRLSSTGDAPATIEQSVKAGAGLCGHAAAVLASAYEEAGIPHRFIRIWTRLGDSHVALEFQDATGNWHFVDPIYGLIVGRRIEPCGEPAAIDAMSMRAYLALPPAMRAVNATCFQQFGLNPTIPRYIKWLDSADAKAVADSNGQLAKIYTNEPETLPHEVVVEIENPAPAATRHAVQDT